MSNGRWNSRNGDVSSPSSSSDRQSRYYDNNSTNDWDRNRANRSQRDNNSHLLGDKGRIRKAQKPNQRYTYSRYSHSSVNQRSQTRYNVESNGATPSPPPYPTKQTDSKLVAPNSNIREIYTTTRNDAKGTTTTISRHHSSELKQQDTSLSELRTVSAPKSKLATVDTKTSSIDVYKDQKNLPQSDSPSGAKVSTSSKISSLQGGIRNNITTTTIKTDSDTRTTPAREDKFNNSSKQEQYESKKSLSTFTGVGDKIKPTDIGAKVEQSDDTGGTKLVKDTNSAINIQENIKAPKTLNPLEKKRAISSIFIPTKKTKLKTLFKKSSASTSVSDKPVILDDEEGNTEMNSNEILSKASSNNSTTNRPTIKPEFLEQSIDASKENAVITKLPETSKLQAALSSLIAKRSSSRHFDKSPTIKTSVRMEIKETNDLSDHEEKTKLNERPVVTDSYAAADPDKNSSKDSENKSSSDPTDASSLSKKSEVPSGTSQSNLAPPEKLSQSEVSIKENISIYNGSLEETGTSALLDDSITNKDTNSLNSSQAVASISPANIKENDAAKDSHIINKSPLEDGLTPKSPETIPLAPTQTLKTPNEVIPISSEPTKDHSMNPKSSDASSSLNETFNLMLDRGKTENFVAIQEEKQLETGGSATNTYQDGPQQAANENSSEKTTSTKEEESRQEETNSGINTEQGSKEEANTQENLPVPDASKETNASVASNMHNVSENEQDDVVLEEADNQNTIYQGTFSIDKLHAIKSEKKETNITLKEKKTDSTSKNERRYKMIVTKLKNKLQKLKDEKIAMDKQICGLSKEVLNYELKVSTLVGKISDIENDRRGLERAYNSLCVNLEIKSERESSGIYKVPNNIEDKLSQLDQESTNSNTLDVITSELLSLESRISDRVKEYRDYTKLLSERQKAASTVPIEDLQVSLESPLVKNLKNKLVNSRKEVIKLQNMLKIRTVNLNSFLMKLEKENKRLKDDLAKNKEYFASVATYMSKSNESILQYKKNEEVQEGKILELQKKLELQKRLGIQQNKNSENIDIQHLIQDNSQLSLKCSKLFTAYKQLYEQFTIASNKIKSTEAALLKEQNSNSELAKVINQQNETIKTLSQTSNNGTAENKSDSYWKDQYDRLLKKRDEEIRQTQLQVAKIHKNYLKLLADKEKGYQEVLQNLTSAGLSESSPVNNFAQLSPPIANASPNGLFGTGAPADRSYSSVTTDNSANRGSMTYTPNNTEPPFSTANRGLPLTNNSSLQTGDRHSTNPPPVHHTMLFQQNQTPSNYRTVPSTASHNGPSTMTVPTTGYNSPQYIDATTNKTVSQEKTLFVPSVSDPKDVVPHYLTYLPAVDESIKET